ncbi:MAG: ATP synthase F1 subunit delta [Armatimonadetes bacterium 55-13]|nr:ATP synthase F1 subunit delta [Armatimonadota bacterium]OJU61454.1 MAG: ATP synthase F1 subunit delta [Armatimonadetes bacterium 55-13]
MVDTKVARRYATALFTTAQKNDVVKSVEDDLSAIVGLLKNDAKFKDFLLSPHVGREEKIKIADKLFSDRVTALTMQALRLVLTKRREKEIANIYSEFVALRREHGSIAFVSVTTAEVLEEDQKKALLAKLEEKLSKKVEAEFDIDGRVIGGIKVTYGNFVLDGTVRGNLRRLGEKLRHDILIS